MSFISNIISNSTDSNATSSRAALFGRRDDTTDWVSYEKAEYMAGGLGPYELQASVESGDIFVLNADGEVEETIESSTFKVINKVTVKGDQQYTVLFSFKLDGQEVTAFLNTAKDGRQYIGLAWAKAIKPAHRGRAF